MAIDKLITYKNKNGNAIIRRCDNCINWKEIEDKILSSVNASKNAQQDLSDKKNKSGYCTREKIYFAHTLEQNRYFVSKYCDLCEHHELKNEKELDAVAEKVKLIDVIKKNVISK